MIRPTPDKLILLMGVSGCGKSTVGAALASALNCPFIEGDDFHSPEAREKMRTGQALTDAERWPWLDRIAAAATSQMAKSHNAVIACSALKQAYRARLTERTPLPLTIVHLRADESTIATRIANRPTHFMPASLIQSQFATLEPPVESENALRISAELPVDAVVSKIIAFLQ